MTALGFGQGVLNPSKYYIVRRQLAATHVQICAEVITYLLSEIVQVVRGATNASAMGFLQLEPLHTIGCESIERNFVVS